MSRNAFDKLMERMSPEEREKIYEIALSYDLDPASPEWIPFAVSQNGLHAINKASIHFADELKTGADHTLRQTMKGMDDARQAALERLKAETEFRQQVIADATQKSRLALTSLANRTEKMMVERAINSFADEAGRVVDEQIVAMKNAQTELAQEMTNATERVRKIHHLSVYQVMGLSTFAGTLCAGLMGSLMLWVIANGYVK